MMNNYRIKIPFWSHTDYSFLVNNTNGWVDDKEQFYEFDNLENFIIMENYLKGGKLSDKYTAEEPQPLKSLNDEYGDTSKVETLLNISYLIDILSNTTYNSLEVGFRHTLLSDREKIERYKDACEHAVDVLTRMFESMKENK